MLRGSTKLEMMNVLFEQWVITGGEWSKSELVIQAKSSFTGRRRGSRQWFTKKQLMDKYGGCEDTADQIIASKLADPITKQACVRPHPELPWRNDLMLYLCYDESSEVDTEDFVIDQMLGLSQNNRVPSRDSSKKKKKKKSKSKKDKKDKKAKRKRSSSSSSSSSSSRGSSESDSSKSSDDDSQDSSDSSSSSKKKNNEEPEKPEDTRSAKEIKKEQKRLQKEEEKLEKKRLKDEENARKKAEREEKAKAEKEKQKVRGTGKKAGDRGD
eukprot:Skav223605  [mRNA]  locus=scaffold493:641546:642457:+ [translate_table: standard]